MNYRKSFYVAYPANNVLRNLINTLKILADSSQRTQAHITVRGPYKKQLSKKDLDRFSNIIYGEILNISKIDNFFAYDQNTVFFKIENNEKLKKVWKKMTYNDFKPHITIYDGDNREFAIELYNLLRKNFVPLPYRIEKLSWLEPKGEIPFSNLETNFSFDSIKDIINFKISEETVKNLTTENRLLLISKVADYIYKNIEQISPTANNG